ncbi:WxcM-like domain-containing protein [Romboutsia weinsteinii]|uniref:WxcM-like domain-containing protein n=1 Tax=Romboutsia weinsteinii TaxID=2020949 RepID=A0A371J443_9FIRM|nr:FdtA/QdtA family cupin domain-containing protein [Romboutsia weinsteinii]RDY27437.1 WxcM-like domain-containing protein [Romboutsia weinsteinii]
MNNSYKIKLNSKGNVESGYLVPLELGINIPFKAKRIFYTYDVPFESNRGSHAYYNTEQVLICLSGSIKIRCFDGKNELVYHLNKNHEALYIGSNVWRTTLDHSPDAILLVLSSFEYDEADYIRDYKKFLEVVGCI